MSNCVYDALESQLLYMGIGKDHPSFKGSFELFMAMKTMTLPKDEPVPAKRQSWFSKKWQNVPKRKKNVPVDWKFAPKKANALVEYHDQADINWALVNNEQWDSLMGTDGTISDATWHELGEGLVPYSPEPKYLDDEWYDSSPEPATSYKSNVRTATSIDFSYTYDGVIPWIYKSIGLIFGMGVTIEYRLWTPDAYMQAATIETQRIVVDSMNKLGIFGKEVVEICLEPASYVRLSPAHAHFGTKPPPQGMGCVMALQFYKL